MKRITLEETKDYIKLTEEDPNKMKKAIAYTLTPSMEEGWEGWEEIGYYGDPKDTTDYSLEVK